MKNTLTNSRYKRFSFEKKILAYLFAICFVIVSIVFLYVKVSKQSRANNNWVQHTEEVLAQMDTVFTLHKDIALTTKGYIITGDSSFLTTHDRKLNSIAVSIQKLRTLTKDNGLLQRRLDTLETMLNEYRLVRIKSIAFRNNSKFRLEDEVPLVYASERTSNQLQTLFHTIQQDERGRLSERRAAFLKNARSVVGYIRILLLAFVVSLLTAFVIVYRNSKKRSKAEAALLKSEALTRSIITHAPVLVNVKDLSGRFMLANNQFAVTMQLQKEDLVGKNSHDILPPETADIMRSADEEVKQTLEPVDLQVDFPAADGMQHLIATKFPLFDEKGKLYSIGSMFMDITPVKRAHEALQESYQQQQRILNGLQQALSASSDMICIVNENCEFVMVSDTISQLLGYTSKEVMSKKFIDFVADEDRPLTKKIADEVLEGKTVFDFVNHYKRKDGTLVPIIWTAKWLPEDRMMYCIARNGTEKVRAEKALAQSQAQLSYAQKIAKMGSWNWDIRDNTWSCSDEIYHLLGIEKNNKANMQKILLGHIHPDDLQSAVKARDEALQQGNPVDIEHRIIKADGQVRFVQTKGEVRFDRENKPILFSGTMQDITERKQAELDLQELNRNLERRAMELKASNAELERFAYVASHDLQEPLRMVTSFLGLLQKKIGGQLDDTSKTYIHYAVDGAERMKGLIRDLLQFSRLGTSRESFAAVDLDELMKHVLQVYELPVRESEAQIQVTPLPVVTGDKTQLQQLLQNLIGNALKYRSNQTPVIKVGCTEKEKEWEFCVSDNGIGIDPKYFDKIFVLFQRLHQKSEFGGNGIGLSICKKIVERHGGRIWVQSRPGNGSTFYFTLKKQNHA